MRLSELAHFTERQLEALTIADQKRYFLFGGARGPGKSYWLRWYLLRFLLRAYTVHQLKGVRVALACETFPALRDRQIEKIQREFLPLGLGDWHGGDFEYRLSAGNGGGVLCLRNLDDATKYQSAEFAAIGIDELTRDSRETFDILRGSLRWPKLERTQFVAATNPNGPGARWVRELWIEGKFPAYLDALRGEFAFLPALPDDNPYLSPDYLAELEALPDQLRRAWRHGDWYAMDDNPAALWKRATFDELRVTGAPELVRIVVAVDPAASALDESNETGIVAAGKAANGHVYVLGDWSLRASPAQWGSQAVTAYHQLKADRIVAETNQGGDMVEAVIRNVDGGVAYRGVRATRGKLTRAEPIAALYERGMVHHVGILRDLETQLTTWTPGETSPDRLDALVWAITELTGGVTIEGPLGV